MTRTWGTAVKDLSFDGIHWDTLGPKAGDYGAEVSGTHAFLRRANERLAALGLSQTLNFVDLAWWDPRLVASGVLAFPYAEVWSMASEKSYYTAMNHEALARMWGVVAFYPTVDRPEGWSDSKVMLARWAEAPKHRLMYLILGDDERRLVGPYFPEDAELLSSPEKEKMAIALPQAPVRETTAESKAAENGEKTQRIVAIMYGIRDEGGWMTPLKRLIEKETKAEVAVLSPDRIALTWFLLAGRYLGYVKSYSNHVATLLSNYEKADVVFIAHSYGTWCLADIVTHWAYGSRPVAIILCGSILPQDYPWTSCWRYVFQRGKERGELPWVWNDIGGRDPFPLIARLLSDQYGDAGVNRFTDPTPGLVVNRTHTGLDHGGCFSKKDDKGNNVLNEDFIRKFWLPIIRGENAPRDGDDESTATAPEVHRLSYWVKTAREMIGWVAVLEFIGWCLIGFFKSEWLVLLGWSLASVGGVILLGWLWMGWRKAPSSKKRRFVALLGILIPISVLISTVMLIAPTMLKKFNSPKPNATTIAPLPTPSRSLRLFRKRYT